MTSSDNIALGPTRQRDTLLGMKLAGRYELHRCIGEGGMGLVYLADHIQLQRPVVVKTLHAIHGGDECALMRFEREAHGLSQLDHPNIVSVYDFGTEGSVHYLVMEYIEGETLRDRINRVGTLPLAVFAPIASQILDAVAHAHRNGLIHRDIKPSNIMLSTRLGVPDHVTVLDFGLAKLLDSDEQTLTHHNRLVGTTAFMAPECMIDEAVVDQRLDVYALGVLFYIMLCGRRPFEGESVAVLYQHVHEPVPPLASRLPPGHDISPGLIQWIHRSLSKNPEDRPWDAGAMLQELVEVLGNPSPPPSAWGTGEHPMLHAGDSSDVLPLVPRPPAEPSYASPGATYPSSRTAVLALGGTFLFLGLLTAVLWSLEPEAPVDSTPAPVTALAPPKVVPVDFASSLDTIDARVEARRFAEAATLLDAVFEDVRGDPALLERATSLRVRIDQGRAFAQAKRLERDGKIAPALEVYLGVLHHDPHQEEAQRQAERLRSFATLKITSDLPSRAYLGSALVGPTPAQVRVPPGSHTVEVRAGSRTRQLQLMIKPRSVQDVHVELADKKAPRKKRPRVETPPPRLPTPPVDPVETPKEKPTPRVEVPKKPPRRVKPVIPLP